MTDAKEMKLGEHGDEGMPEIGAIESVGQHKGEIYGGIWTEEYDGDNKPIWFSIAPRLMDHYAAAAWAKEQGGALPTKRQGFYLSTIKDKGGAFTELFDRGEELPDGCVWLAEPDSLQQNAWCQSVSDIGQYITSRKIELPVLSVRR